MFDLYRGLQDTVLNTVLQSTDIPEAAIEKIRIGPADDPAHGHIACNAPLILQQYTDLKGRALAEVMAKTVIDDDRIALAQAAGPGFLNLSLTSSAWQDALGRFAALPDFQFAAVSFVSEAPNDFRAAIVGAALKAIQTTNGYPDNAPAIGRKGQVAAGGVALGPCSFAVGLGVADLHQPMTQLSCFTRELPNALTLDPADFQHEALSNPVFKSLYAQDRVTQLLAGAGNCGNEQVEFTTLEASVAAQVTAFPQALNHTAATQNPVVLFRYLLELSHRSLRLWDHWQAFEAQNPAVISNSAEIRAKITLPRAVKVVISTVLRILAPSLQP